MNNGKPESSGDEVRARRALADGAPPGATGYYLAPLTEGRSADPNDKVKSIGMSEAMDYIGKHLHLAEVLNTPEALTHLQQDQQSGAWDPQEYLRALAGVGVKAEPKLTTKETVIPAGGKLNTKTYDQQGRLVKESTTEGNPRTRSQTLIDKAQELADTNGTTFDEEYAKLRGSGNSLQARLDAVDADDTLTPKQKEIEKRAIRSGIKPGKYSGDGLAAGSTGAGGGGADDKRLGRMLQALKEDRPGLEKRKEVALAEYKADIHEASTTERKTAKVKYDGVMSKLNEEDAGIRKRMDDIDNKLTPGGDGLATKPGAKVMKFDKTGKLVAN